MALGESPLPLVSRETDDTYCTWNVAARRRFFEKTDERPCTKWNDSAVRVSMRLSSTARRKTKQA